MMYSLNDSVQSFNIPTQHVMYHVYGIVRFERINDTVRRNAIAVIIIIIIRYIILCYIFASCGVYYYYHYPAVPTKTLGRFRVKTSLGKKQNTFKIENL